MRLQWVDPEVVTIPDVGQVKPGVEFTIDDRRGADLVQRKVAKVVGVPVPAQEDRKVKTMVQKDDARSVRDKGVDNG
jgi:hypothetical protein